MRYTTLGLTGKKQRANEWAPRHEVQKMAQLLDLPITSMRYHIAPRKRLQKPAKEGKGRITLMFGEKSSTALICQETEAEVKSRPKDKRGRPRKKDTYMQNSRMACMKSRSMILKNG